MRLFDLRKLCAERMQTCAAGDIAQACTIMLDNMPGADAKMRVSLLGSILKGLLALAERVELESVMNNGSLSGCRSSVDAQRSLRYALGLQPNANAVASCFVCFFEVLRFERLWFGQVRTACRLQLERSVTQ
jgi:hypothetical protein